MTEQVEKTNPDVAPWADGELVEALGQQAEAKKRIRWQYMGRVAQTVFEENFRALLVPICFFLGAALLFPALGQWLLSSDAASNGLQRRQISEYTSGEMEVVMFSWLYLFMLLTLVHLLVAQVRIARYWKAARKVYKAENY